MDQIVTLALGAGAVIGGLVVTSMAVMPLYNIWAQKLQGQADLAQSFAETQIAVQEAQREYEASKLYAQADVERARGIAASIREVEDALGGPEGYLRWKYIHMLEEQDGVAQIIYVPTEAGLPVLEAGKRPSPPKSGRA